MEFFCMQSRTPFNMRSTRRSSAIKCGSHSTGAIGSLAKLSRIISDNGFGPLWNLHCLWNERGNWQSKWFSTKIFIELRMREWIRFHLIVFSLDLFMCFLFQILTLRGVQVLSLLSCSTVTKLQETFCQIHWHVHYKKEW